MLMTPNSISEMLHAHTQDDEGMKTSLSDFLVRSLDNNQVQIQSYAQLVFTINAPTNPFSWIAS